MFSFLLLACAAEKGDPSEPLPIFAPVFREEVKLPFKINFKLFTNNCVWR